MVYKIHLMFYNNNRGGKTCKITMLVEKYLNLYFCSKNEQTSVEPGLAHFLFVVYQDTFSIILKFF